MCAYCTGGEGLREALCRERADHGFSRDLQAQGVNITTAAFDYPEHYQMSLPGQGQDGEPSSKRLCTGGDPALAYPDTDAQYPDYTPQEPQPSAATTGAQQAATGGEASAAGDRAAWVAVWDARYNAYYYYNALTNETVWQCPYPQDGAKDQAASGVAGEAGEGGDKEEGKGDDEQQEGEEEGEEGGGSDEEEGEDDDEEGEGSGEKEDAEEE